AQLRKKGRLLTDNFFDESTVTNQKDIMENSEYESFKAEVRKKLSTQESQISEIAQNQKIMAVKQDDMSADLKAIIAILSQK
ncbi:hypothetical protein A2U01_0060054, partial [Trifolium medium]|nr:hypothetical protein [Trifolium medium]